MLWLCKVYIFIVKKYALLNCEIPFYHIWIEGVIVAMLQLDVTLKIGVYYGKIARQPGIEERYIHVDETAEDLVYDVKKIAIV